MRGDLYSGVRFLTRAPGEYGEARRAIMASAYRALTP
jgi:hypothetical protein